MAEKARNEGEVLKTCELAAGGRSREDSVINDFIDRMNKISKYNNDTNIIGAVLPKFEKLLETDGVDERLAIYKELLELSEKKYDSSTDNTMNTRIFGGMRGMIQKGIQVGNCKIEARKDVSKIKVSTN